MKLSIKNIEKFLTFQRLLYRMEGVREAVAIKSKRIVQMYQRASSPTFIKGHGDSSRRDELK